MKEPTIDDLPAIPPGGKPSRKPHYEETCSVCGKKYNTYDSPMLKNEIWEQVSNEHFDKDGNWVTQHICFECMEERLGRRITEDDLMMDTTLFGSTTTPLHVMWNTEGFLQKHFPNHKYKTFEMQHPELILEYMRAYNAK